MDTTEDLLELTRLYGPSRSERPVAEYLVERLSPYLDECYIDEHNNFIGVKKGSGPTVLVDAHIDEVSHLDPSYEPQLEGTRLRAKALDDRVGVAVLMDVARSLQGREGGPTVYLVGAAMEEIGKVGAGYVAEKLRADYAIAVDATYLDRVEMGGGPVVTRAPDDVPHRATDALFAANEGRPTQVSPYSYSFDLRTTDGEPYFDAEMDTAVLSVVVDNMHHIPETTDVRDVAATAELVKRTIEELGRQG
jgi:putative aminopeptidase FrvX